MESASVRFILLRLLAAAAANPTHHWLAGCIAAGRHHPFLCASDLDFVRSDSRPFSLKSGR